MDEIVSTVYFEGAVYIFTKYGKVYQMVRDEYSTRVEFKLMAEMPLRQ